MLHIVGMVTMFVFCIAWVFLIQVRVVENLRFHHVGTAKDFFTACVSRELFCNLSQLLLML